MVNTNFCSGPDYFYSKLYIRIFRFPFCLCYLFKKKVFTLFKLNLFIEKVMIILKHSKKIVTETECLKKYTISQLRCASKSLVYKQTLEAYCPWKVTKDKSYSPFTHLQNGLIISLTTTHFAYIDEIAI